MRRRTDGDDADGDDELRRRGAAANGAQKTSFCVRVTQKSCRCCSMVCLIKRESQSLEDHLHLLLMTFRLCSSSCINIQTVRRSSKRLLLRNRRRRHKHKLLLPGFIDLQSNQVIFITTSQETTTTDHVIRIPQKPVFTVFKSSSHRNSCLSNNKEE